MTLEILSIICRKGAVHDFRILKESHLPIHRGIEKLGDAGYQGIQRIYENSRIPIKKTKKRPLSAENKKYNRELAKKRIFIEHINRRCKILRIVKETYRGKHKNYGKTWNIVAALVNLRYVA